MTGKRWLQTLEPDYLLCRDMGHVWRHLNDGAPVREAGVITFTRFVSCMRCTTTRTETLHVFRTGHVEKVGVRYSYPDDYLLTKGESGKRQDVWREVVRRKGMEWEVSDAVSP